MSKNNPLRIREIVHRAAASDGVSASESETKTETETQYISCQIFVYTKNIILSLGILESTADRVLLSCLYFHFFLLQVLWSRYSSLERDRDL